ncbi:hypothetical protein V8F20_005816 [Naviculisporaceae sp. PSN 640]
MNRHSSSTLRRGGVGKGEGAAPPTLPKQFTELSQVLEGRVPLGAMINMIGMVKDCRLPVPTNGTDFKSTLTLFDLSTQESGGDITFSIFRPEHLMPEVSARDVVVIFQAKVQRYSNNPISLITNRATKIHVYTADKIPRFPKSALPALVLDKNTGRSFLEDDHHRYVSYFYQGIDKEEAPDQEEFQKRAMVSLNVKDKFSLLKDIEEGKFYNLIVRVAREPFDLMDKMTLYVSDYTENDAFFNVQWNGLSNLPGLHGNSADDPYGYGAEAEPSPGKSQWVGPYGKQAMQLTCWPPHTDFIRTDVSAGDWIYLRNVQIRRGHDGQYLEGFLREDRDATTKINVDIMNALDRDNMDPRLKEAIRRWRDYEKKKHKQEKAVVSEIKAAQVAGAKRRGEDVDEVKAAQLAGAKRRGEDVSEVDQPKMNAKKRRKAQRAAREKEVQEKRLKEEAEIELNGQIACEEQSKPPSTIESMLEMPTYRITVDGLPVDAVVPFSCSKFRGRVRVVDFHPRNLKDFARRRFTSQWDVLSDQSENDESSDDEESLMERGYKPVWEWRFALELQDALPRKGSDGEKPKSLWVIVDNSEGQYLTGLDACDLSEDADALNELRDRMFTLWGNLEEKNSKDAKRKTPPPNKSTNGARGKSTLPQLERPPLDSSDNEHGDDNDRGVPREGGNGAEAVPEEALSNRPFDCCIKSYGLPSKALKNNKNLPTGNPEKDWIRTFALFGTKIRSG